MDIEKIPRRERRHYRRYKDGEIVYSEYPLEETKKSSSSFSQEDKQFKSLLDLDGEKKNLKTDSLKNEKIKKVLSNLSDIISPDIDSIADVIYNQIKNDDFYDFKKKEIENTIKGSKHYRATKTEDNQEIVSSDNIKSLVEDVFVQLEKENVKNLEKKKEDVVKIKKEEKKKESKTDKKGSTKKVEVKKEKKSDIQDLLDDDADLEDDADEDDLGLKF
jgi:hypothetical protein